MVAVICSQSQSENINGKFQKQTIHKFQVVILICVMKSHACLSVYVPPGR
jgi:hypothetical protein